MTQKIPELSRRQLLAAMAMSSLAGFANGSPISEPDGPNHFGSGNKGRPITFNAKVSRDGQHGVTVPIGIDAGRTVIIVCDMQNDFGSKGGMFDRAGIDITMIQRLSARLRKSWRRLEVRA